TRHGFEVLTVDIFVAGGLLDIKRQRAGRFGSVPLQAHSNISADIGGMLLLKSPIFLKNRLIFSDRLLQIDRSGAQSTAVNASDIDAEHPISLQAVFLASCQSQIRISIVKRISPFVLLGFVQ